MCRTVGREERLLNKEMNTCHLWTVTAYKRRSLALLIIVFSILMKIVLEQHEFHLSKKAQKWQLV